MWAGGSVEGEQPWTGDRRDALATVLADGGTQEASSSDKCLLNCVCCALRRQKNAFGTATVSKCLVRGRNEECLDIQAPIQQAPKQHICHIFSLDLGK